MQNYQKNLKQKRKHSNSQSQENNPSEKSNQSNSQDDRENLRSQMGLETSRIEKINLDQLLSRKKRCGIIVSQKLQNLFTINNEKNQVNFSFGSSFKVKLSGKEVNVIMGIQCSVYPRGIRIPFGFDD